MNKTLLIIRREYLSRVQKKSFILLTILMPLIFAGIYALGIYLAVKPGEEKVIGVIDNSELFGDKFTDTESLKFEYSESSENDLKTNVSNGDISGALIIPLLDLEDPDGIILYSKEAFGIRV